MPPASAHGIISLRSVLPESNLVPRSLLGRFVCPLGTAALARAFCTGDCRVGGECVVVGKKFDAKGLRNHHAGRMGSPE